MAAASYSRLMRRPMSKARRRKIARKTRAIMKPKPPDKESPMTKSNVKTVAISTAVGSIVGTTIFVVLSNAAFRVPKDLKKFLPKK
jgi:hypothetical protein